MTTIAERVTSLANRRGVAVTFTRSASEDEGETYDPLTDEETPGTPPATSFTVKAMTDKVDADDFRSGTLIVQNPVAILVPNAPAVTFAPAPGMAFTMLGVVYTVADVAPRILDGAVQFWRVLGGV